MLYPRQLRKRGLRPRGRVAAFGAWDCMSQARELLDEMRRRGVILKARGGRLDYDGELTTEDLIRLETNKTELLELLTPSPRRNVRRSPRASSGATPQSAQPPKSPAKVRRSGATHVRIVRDAEPVVSTPEQAASPANKGRSRNRQPEASSTGFYLDQLRIPSPPLLP